MTKKIGAILLIASLASIAWIAIFAFRADYWLSPPHEKLTRAWSEDIRLLTETGKLPTGWNQVSKTIIKADNSPIQEWLGKVRAPVKINPDGKYRLEIFLIHWIEGHRYGVVVQHNLVEQPSGNTVWELSRTYHLGIIY